MIIYKLASFLKTSEPSLRSHFYRHQHLLEKNCADISLGRFLEAESAKECIAVLAKCAPLTNKDFFDHKQILWTKKWLHYLPADRAFFKMVEDQIKLWRRFENKSLRSFIQSVEGCDWIRKRHALRGRPALFELDQPFRDTSAKALAHEIKIKQLLRRAPLLGYKDLADLKVKNLQPIWERFYQLKDHRARYLERVVRRQIAEK